ncbi:NAD-dependent succinate-semialdehyde dehydrogenase [Serratia rubidaea]|uniref:NAD-dependent succinate-semialdehyde dehydrogenase n=1 Tax=Serratia rubidaea TaxID=61652 RepID=UPI0023B11599|nr:NAD-dependent succinate-semialdehyde dehydrogenase [Serratia rubidaea]MDK1703140.1 NAD-dependent succinate-semialdehyde dehydrogenase [Serratia rubidaea]
MKLEDPRLFRHFAWINGEWCHSESGAEWPVYNPADNSLLGYIPLLEPAQIDRAVDAAEQAFARWRQVRADRRAALLMAWYQQLLAHRDDLATLLVHEQGKPRREAEGEVDYAAGFIRWFAEEAVRINGETLAVHIDGTLPGTLKEPVGVCALITPWNFPLAMITRKAAAALAAGCSVLVKPANETPFSALALAELAERAGLPSGVFNVITGDPQAVCAQLCEEPRVRALSFTGSTRVGKLLLAQCAGSVKRVSLELGGNAPFVVAPDVNIDEAAAAAIDARFQTSGQDCLAANRIMVHQQIHEAFIEAFTARLRALKVGPGDSPDSDIGPLIHRQAVDKAQALVDDALSRGARLIHGDQRQAPGDNYFMPTLLIGVTPAMRVWQEESFAPIAAVAVWQHDDQAIALANASEYGLAAYLWTHDQRRVWRYIRELEYGMVAVNSVKMTGVTVPFGGIKQSGLGREGGRTGIDEYLTTRYFCLGGLSGEPTQPSVTGE